MRILNRRGRTSKSLSVEDRRRLRKYQSDHSRRLGVSVGLPQLKLAMEAPFSWETIRRALEGRPIWHSYHEFIVTFLDRVEPRAQAAMDFKSRASGEHEEEDAEPIHRGSR